MSAVDANALVNDGAGGGETAQGNSGEEVEHNQRNNLNIHIEALVDGMVDYRVNFVVEIIAAIKTGDQRLKCEVELRVKHYCIPNF